MNTLSLIPLVSLDTRFWLARATSLYCRAQSLPLWLSPSVTRLAVETHGNIRSLRAVGTLCPIPPSLLRWVLTVALLFLVSPRLALASARLFAACVAFGLAPYRRLLDVLMFVVGVALGLAIALTLGGET